MAFIFLMLVLLGLIFMAMPVIFTLVMLASIGVPGLNGFVGEFLILAGTFSAHRWWAVVSILGVVISAVYMLWAYQQVFHGSRDEGADESTFRDVTTRERLVLVPLIVLIVFLGVYPKPVLDRIEPSVNQLLAHIHQVQSTNSGTANALSPVEGK